MRLTVPLENRKEESVPTWIAVAIASILTAMVVAGFVYTVLGLSWKSSSGKR